MEAASALAQMASRLYQDRILRHPAQLLELGLGVVSAVAVIVVVLLAVVTFWYKRTGGPWYRPLASGEAKTPATQLRRVPTQEPPYELS
jgi:hypothetical protein